MNKPIPAIDERDELIERLRAQRDHADDWRTTLAEQAADLLERDGAEIARLKAGGCARDQRTTQYCADDCGCGARDDGTGTEDWGVTRITDQITAWPGLGCGPDPLADFGRKCQHGRLRRKCEVCEVMAECIAIETRLRTTAEALRAATTWAAPMRDAPKSARPEWFDDARAVLAQLEKDGLA